MKKITFLILFICQFSISQVEYINGKILLKYKNEETGQYEIFDPQNCLLRNSSALYTANRIIIVNKSLYENNGTIEHILPNGSVFRIYEEWNDGNLAPFNTFDINDMNNHYYHAEGVPFVWHSLLTSYSNFYVKWDNNYISFPIINFSPLFTNSTYTGHFKNQNGSSTSIPINQNNEIKIFYENASPNSAFDLQENTTIRWALYANDQVDQPAIIRGSFQKNNQGNILTNLQPGFLRLTWNNSNLPLSNNMNNYCTHTLVLYQSTTAIGNSRSIKLTANNIDNGIVFLGNHVEANSSSFFLDNNHLIIHHPVAKFSGDNTFYCLFSEFDENLCFVNSKKIPYNLDENSYINEFYNAIDKPLGGFAINSWKNINPITIRNYDASGAILYCKSFNFSNDINSSPYHKLVANERNNNLFLLRAGNYNDQNQEPILNGMSNSLFTDLVEIDNSGTVINSFRIVLPKNTIFYHNGNQYYHSFQFSTTEATNAIYVKGAFGEASDRIWVPLTLSNCMTYLIDSTGNATFDPSFLNNSLRTIVLVINPTNGTAEASIISSQEFPGLNKLIIDTPSVGWNNAQLMMSCGKNIFKFNNHYSSNPNNKFIFNNLTENFIDFKKHDSTLLLSDINGNFMKFNPLTLSYIQRKENVTDAANVVFNKFLSTDLFLNYTNSNVNYIIKQPIEDFDYTCQSTSVGTYSATSENPIFYQYNSINTYPIVVTSLDIAYQEIVDNSIFTIADICGTTCNTMSINENFKSNELTFYPNPTQNIVTIDSTFENIKVYNAIGQEVVTKTQQINNQTIVDLSPFTNGAYFIKIEKDAIKKTIKIIKH